VRSNWDHPRDGLPEQLGAIPMYGQSCEVGGRLRQGRMDKPV
jgi:hypothetical protein